MSSRPSRISSVAPDAVDYSGDATEIRVENTKFLIRKSIICKTSEFFKNAAKPGWEGEDGPRPMILDEDDTARIFKL
ncbi:hypothetical protein CC86DRAFT_405341 [Ophiobolus disseminans]|uniref:BTB domain-containing protein n=1 Tax=Ophiobolus disseminans TaxID=1469910 RepID=A0A6A7A364_9PLEO|nr:hypothetical protein CC86DRAFT_405341 [Ophiobolus disseminans]